MSEVKGLYFGGLSGNKSRGPEARILQRLAQRGVHLEPVGVDWRDKEPFTDFLARMTDQARELLKSKGSIALVGASAGGSLAINIFGQLKSDKVTAVSLSGRLTRGELPVWDPRTLERSTHLETSMASQLCYDSIVFCEDATLPSLSEDDKRLIHVIKPLLDPVVPRSTMDIDGIESVTVPIIGHQPGIGLGLLRLPEIWR